MLGFIFLFVGFVCLWGAVWAHIAYHKVKEVQMDDSTFDRYKEENK